MKDKGTVFVAIIAAALIALYFFRDKLYEVITVKMNGQATGGGSFCAPGYVPVSLGVAPEWSHVAVDKIRFFVDPATGCLYEGGTARVLGWIHYITLSDAGQIARFLSMNGAPPNGSSAKQVVLGAPVCAPSGFPGKVSISGTPCLPGVTNPCPEGARLETGPDGNPVCVQYV